MRCVASVLIDDHVHTELVALHHGSPVDWVCGCVLEFGHPGRHHAPTCRVGERGPWVSWDNAGQAEIDTVGPPLRAGMLPAPPPTSAPPPEPPAASQLPRPAAAPQHRPPPGPGHPHRNSVAPPAADPQTQALWAIARAIEHLAQVIAANGSSPNGHRGIPLRGPDRLG